MLKAWDGEEGVRVAREQMRRPDKCREVSGGGLGTRLLGDVMEVDGKAARIGVQVDDKAPLQPWNGLLKMECLLFADCLPIDLEDARLSRLREHLPDAPAEQMLAWTLEGLLGAPVRVREPALRVQREEFRL